MTTFRCIPFSLVLMAATVAGVSRADDKPAEPVKTAEAKPRGKTYSVEELCNVLEDLALNPQAAPVKEGAPPLISMQYKSGNWNLNSFIVYGQNGTMLTLLADIEVLEGNAAVAPEALDRLMTLNQKIFPVSCFTFKKDGKTFLRLGVQIPNRSLTVSELRVKMDEFNEAIKAVRLAYDEGVAEAKTKVTGSQSAKAHGKPTTPAGP